MAGGSWRRAAVASLALHAAIGAWLVMDWRRMTEAGGGAAEAALVVDWVPSRGEPDGADEPAAEAAAPPAPDLTAAVAAPAPPMPQLVQDVPPPPVIVPDAPAPPAVPPPPLPQLAMAMPPVVPLPASPVSVAAPEPSPTPLPDPSERAEAEPVPEATPPPVMEQTVPVVPVEHLPTPPPSPPPPPQQVASTTPAPAPSTPVPRPASPPVPRPRRGTPDAAQHVAARGPAVAPAAGAGGAQPDDAGGGPLVIRAPRYRRPPRPPQYPARAVDLGLTGTVMVRALVSPDGDTQETRLWRSSGHPLLDAAAVAAVRRWAFEPARHGGRAVPAWVEVPVHFRLN